MPFAFTLASRSGGSTANPYGDDAETTAFLAGKGPNPFAWGASAAAGASSSTAAQKHTANLGPTGLSAYATAPAGASQANFMGPRFDSPDSDDYPGTHLTHAYNEQETLKFFQDAATGYDFNEEGEAAMEDALATIGLEKQGDYLKE